MSEQKEATEALLGLSVEDLPSPLSTSVSVPPQDEDTTEDPEIGVGEIDALTDEDFDVPYVATILSRPAGIYFYHNYIFIVHPGTPAATGGVLSHSRVLKVNDAPVKPGTTHFNRLFRGVVPPFTLTLQHRILPPGAAVNQRHAATPGGAKEALTKKDLIAVSLVYLSVFMNWFSNMMALPVLPFLTKQNGMGDSELGYLVAIYQLAGIPGGLMTLAIAQWKGTKYGMLFSVFGSAVSLLLTSFSWNFGSLLAFRIIAGLTGNAVPVAITYLGMTIPTPLKPRYFSFVGLTVMVCMVIAPAFGGALVNYGVSVPFQAGAGFAFAGTLVTAAFLPNLLIPKKSSTDPGKFNRFHYACLLYSFFKSLSYTAGVSMMSNYLLGRFGFTGQSVGLVMSGHGTVAAVNTAFLYPLVFRKLGMYLTYTIGFVLMTLGFTLAGFMPTWWAYILCVSLLCGPGYGYVMNAVSPILDRWASPSNRARLNSYGQMCDSLGFTIGAAVWGNVLTAGNSIQQPGLLWWVAGATSFVVVVASSVLYIFIFRKEEVASKQANAHALCKERELKYVNFRSEMGTDEDYMKLGRRFGSILGTRHYKWTSYMDLIEKRFKMFFPPLPIDSVENYWRAIQSVEHEALHAEAYYKYEDTIFHDAFAAFDDYKQQPHTQ